MDRNIPDRDNYIDHRWIKSGHEGTLTPGCGDGLLSCRYHCPLWMGISVALFVAMLVGYLDKDL